jgi:hypothetical protein
VFSDLLTMTKELEVTYRQRVGCFHRTIRKRAFYVGLWLLRRDLQMD